MQQNNASATQLQLLAKCFARKSIHAICASSVL